jgi:hypothetical protein
MDQEQEAVLKLGASTGCISRDRDRVFSEMDLSLGLDCF